MYYDLIIISQSSPDLIPVTQQCIDSARADICNLNIIVVETGQPYKYKVDKIVEYNGEFNYNRALNLGLKYAKGDVHILANNDIIFFKGWSKIGDLMKINGYHSASAFAGHMNYIKQGEFIYPGHKVGTTLTGWCIFMDAYCYSKIGTLDESVPFWYSDDLYSLQLQNAGINHGLFANIRVDHMTSTTLKRQPSRVARYYQTGAKHLYNKRKMYYATRGKS